MTAWGQTGLEAEQIFCFICQTVKYRHGHMGRNTFFFSFFFSPSPQEREDRGTTDPWYTSLLAFRERDERSFCQCHNESPGQQREREGRRIRVDIWKERKMEGVTVIVLRVRMSRGRESHGMLTVVTVYLQQAQINKAWLCRSIYWRQILDQGEWMNTGKLSLTKVMWHDVD